MMPRRLRIEPSRWTVDGRHARSLGGISFVHRGAFWIGFAAVSAGVVLHVPMFLDAGDMHYRLVGMSPDPGMLAGMALILGGLAAVGYGIVPRERQSAPRAGRVMFTVLDDARIDASHVAVILVMSIAVTIDAMKPITLGFVVPGMAKEYALQSPLNPHGSVPVAFLPLFGLGGTLLGSVLWGWFGDAIGRRASILLAGIVFIATSICGAMPSYQWNFFMCFMMGIGVGGMLPITVTLVAELLPKQHRGWAMVIIGGELAAAYVLTSWSASLLTPIYGWRILWFLGLPTGMVLLALQRFIPESPRHLLLAGRIVEARAVMARYGLRLAADPSIAASSPRSFARARRVRIATSIAVVALGLGAGLVTYGFQLWIPTNLQRLGFTQATSAGFLRDSALIGLPVTIMIAVLYSVWSARGTIFSVTAVTVVALTAFVVAGNSVVDHRTLLHVLLIVPTAAINSVLAVALAYTAEIYPTRVRSRATGLVAAVSKAGGVLLTALVVAAVAPASIRDTALLGAVPLSVGLIALLVGSFETRARTLDDGALDYQDLASAPTSESMLDAV